MRILVACERSGKVRRAFREAGHDAWSCDLEPADDGSKYHIQDNVIPYLQGGSWDMLIAHPTCTKLTKASAWMWPQWQADGSQYEAIKFFMEFVRSPIKRKCIENPVGIMSTIWCKPDQIIHPWEHGHPDKKATCLWLSDLPLLRPTNIIAPKFRCETVGDLGPQKHRAKRRSETFSGIASAMATQWGNL